MWLTLGRRHGLHGYMIGEIIWKIGSPLNVGGGVGGMSVAHGARVVDDGPGEYTRAIGLHGREGGGKAGYEAQDQPGELSQYHYG